jgi:hypothetical protein
MATVVDPKDLRPSRLVIPGAKPPVVAFGLGDTGEPGEVDAFNRLVRELRQQSPAMKGEPLERPAA